MRLLQNSCMMTPLPLRACALKRFGAQAGGGWGVGEAATCRFHGELPPTLTLPRKGGGDFLDFCKNLKYIRKAVETIGSFFLTAQYLLYTVYKIRTATK
jgi:hypothetical protein